MQASLLVHVLIFNEVHWDIISHNTYFTHLEQTIQWFVVYSQNCTDITTNNFRACSLGVVPHLQSCPSRGNQMPSSGLQGYQAVSCFRGITTQHAKFKVILRCRGNHKPGLHELPSQHNFRTWLVPSKRDLVPHSLPFPLSSSPPHLGSL